MQPNIIERVWRQDKMVNVDVLNGFVFTGEAGAHKFVISGKNVNTPVDISGTITANFKNADNVLVPLDGAIEDGKAVVVLSQECYAVEGPFSLMIFADTVCIYAAIANAINSSGETIAYPTATIPSVQELIEEVQDVIASIPQDYSALNQSVQDLKSNFDSVYTRKNLLPIGTITKTVFGVDVVYADGILTLDGTPTQSGGRLIHIIDLVLPAGTYTLYRKEAYSQIFVEKSSDDDILLTIATNAYSGSFTLNTETNCYIGMNVDVSKTYSDELPMDIQLEAGSEFTSFEKPSEGTAIDRQARARLISILGEVVSVISTVETFDLNSAVNNTIRRCPIGCTNAPDTQGTVLTVGSTSDTGYQLYVSYNGNVYTRSKWSTWGNWIKIVTGSNFNDYLLANNGNILSAYNNITCCGDSLTWGQVYTSASGSRRAYKPYPTVLEELTGATVANVATAGYSTIDWWTNYNAQITEKTNQLVIVYLGNNGNLTDTLSTDAPENVDYTEYADDTNTGCYAKIVAKSLSVGAKVLLVKCYATNATTNTVIDQIATRFGCGVVENPKLGDVYRTYPDGTGVNPVHYNDLGYSQFAKNLIVNCGNMPSNYMKYMIPN